MPARPLLALIVAAAAIGCGDAAPANAPRMSAPAAGPRMPGPGAARGLEAARANEACAGCHLQEAAEWRGSLHQRAQIDPSYERAFAIEPMAFCQSCHAPEADPEGEVAAAVGAIGVGCVTCHDAGGGVLAGPRARSPGVRAPHAIARSEAFADRAGCASCHEFAFPVRPGPPGLAPRELMQSTIAEGAASTAPGARCASCHMPSAGEGSRAHASHRFTVVADPEAVRRAVAVTAERTARGAAVTLAPRSIGHAFPTGDLFRRLEVSVEAVGADQAVVAERRRYLARHFGEVHGGGNPRALLADDRVGLHGAEPSRVELDLGAAAAGRPIAVRVAYQRVAHPRGVDESTALVDDEIVLFEGTLPP
jgi:nitrate reductase cytochrome c-type subunit